MILQKIISTRPSLDVPFFKISQELEDFQKNGHGMNIFVEKKISYSPNNLVEIVEVTYKSAEEMKAVFATDLIKATNRARIDYCKANNIIMSRGVGEVD
jgi:hypothetical protein